MKKMKNFIYLLFLSSGILLAQNSFEKGNDYYQKAQYKEAIEVYETILNSQQKESFELYFNLANSYYKLNKVAPAIYNYEKALRLGPENQAALNNLAFAKKLLIDDIKEMPKLGFSALLHQFTGQLRFDTWGLLSITASIMFLLAFVVYYFTQKPHLKRTFFCLMIVLLVAIPILLGMAFFEKIYFENERTAIVFTEKTMVKSEPITSSPTIFSLHEGTKISLLENLKEWQKIQLADGTQGWIKAENIKEIK
jgi:tetratricopeptide (TPR) repeat protein